MKIIEPNVEIIKQENEISHVAKCARVCYKKETGDDKHLYNTLIKNNHLSMLRHSTHYYIIPCDKANSIIYDIFNIVCNLNNKIVGLDISCNINNYYLVLNGQYKYEYPKIVERIKNYQVSEEKFINTEIGYNMRRITFKVTTQISTSRELNRVSPNNISEQSTRYVYEDGTICRPHWLNGYQVLYTILNQYIIYKNGLPDTDINQRVLNYIKQCNSSFECYRYLIDAKIPRQDARGVLPLDTATICVYTYSIEEWRNIINLRYFGTTGKPHPNAKIIAGMIKDELEQLGYEFKSK